MNRPILTALVMLSACSSSEQETAPVKEPGGTSELASGRRIRRLSADQFHASLQVATGQSWSQFDNFAPALGRADYAVITNENTDLSVSFDKLVHDAARETCRAAVADDASGENQVILRHATSTDRDHATLVANLQYLFLRFLGEKIDSTDDERLVPWLTLLESQTAAPTDMSDRWTAVCVGLVTHPDFLTY